MKKVLILSLLAILGGCATQDQMWGLASQERIAPNEYQSPMKAAMQCAYRSNIYAGDIRLGVGMIGAEDGIFAYEYQGRYAPKSIHHMTITALKASGFRVVNRIGEVTSIMEWENARASEKILGDDKYSWAETMVHAQDEHGEPLWNQKDGTPVLEPGRKQVYFRVFRQGQILGSSHIVSGSISRVDFDTSSGGFELTINGVGIGKRAHRMLIGMDIHVTNTISGEVELAKAYEKQLYGVEVKAGVYRLIDSQLVDINAGVQTAEPRQAGVAYMIDYMAYDLARAMKGVGKECDEYLPEPINYQG